MTWSILYMITRLGTRHYSPSLPCILRNPFALRWIRYAIGHVRLQYKVQNHSFHSSSASLGGWTLIPGSAPMWCPPISSALTCRSAFISCYVLMSTESIRCFQNTIRFSRLYIQGPNTGDGDSHLHHLCCSCTRCLCRSSSSSIGIITIRGDGKGNALQGRVGRKFFGPHEHMCKVAGDPLGISSVLVATCDVPSTTCSSRQWPSYGALFASRG